MAIFTYLATAIVTAYTGAAVVAGTWAAFAVSVIATGLATITARVFGVGARGGSGTRDQGVRIQLPPSTENKVPIIYGTVYQQGIITDARISNNNQTMTYVLTLSERTDSGTFSCSEVYWNDQLLVFGADGYTVESSIQSDGALNTQLSGLVRVWVYAGGTASANQILGPSPAVNAYDTLGDNSLYALTDLVFALVQIDYNSEKGTTGLPTMTFKITNSLHNPALVWYDYVKNTRYGAGFDVTEINTTTSINTLTTTSLYSISEEIPLNQYALSSRFLGSVSGTTLTVDTMQTGTILVGYRIVGTGMSDDVFISSYISGSGQTGTYALSTSNTLTNRILATVTATNQVRYQINGVLNTGDTVKTNMERINLASASWTTYNYKTGQWQIVTNRPVSQTEISNSYHFNDDNIIGEITLTSSNLEDLYNQLEAGYASRSARDQTDYFRASIPTAEQNDLETVNTLQITYGMVNNPIHAGRLGLLELRQNRKDLLITFLTDYGALVCEVGDVVRVSNPIYGFTEKLFRITRIRETESEDATIAAEITAIEYNQSVYVDSTLSDISFVPVTGIPSEGSSQSLPAPSQPTLQSTDFYTFTLRTQIAAGSSPVDSVEFFYSTNSTTNFSLITTSPAAGQWIAGDYVDGFVSSLGPGTYYYRARTSLGTQHSDFSTTSTAITWTPNYDFGGI